MTGKSVMPGKDASVPGAALSGRERKLVLDGGCLELLSWCEGMCCRGWDVPLTLQEYESGAYDAERVCLLSTDLCKESASSCSNRRLRLRRRSDQSCVYLQDSKCSIYGNRPKVCREFTCKGGWRLATVLPAEGVASASPNVVGKDQFISSLRDDMVFVQHPLVKLATLFYLKEKKTVIFVTKLAGPCRDSTIREPFFNPNLGEKDMFDLITLFETKDSLGEVRRQFATKRAQGLEKPEFDEIVWLLSKSRIIMNAEAFRGTLEGIHRTQCPVTDTP
jgi:hypothetical protein